MLANICLRILKHAILDLIFTFPDAILIVDRDLVLQFDYYYFWIKKKKELNQGKVPMIYLPKFGSNNRNIIIITANIWQLL